LEEPHHHDQAYSISWTKTLKRITSVFLITSTIYDINPDEVAEFKEMEFSPPKENQQDSEFTENGELLSRSESSDAPPDPPSFTINDDASLEPPSDDLPPPPPSFDDYNSQFDDSGSRSSIYIAQTDAENSFRALQDSISNLSRKNTISDVPEPPSQLESNSTTESEPPPDPPTYDAFVEVPGGEQQGPPDPPRFDAPPEPPSFESPPDPPSFESPPDPPSFERPPDPPSFEGPPPPEPPKVKKKWATVDVPLPPSSDSELDDILNWIDKYKY